MSGYKEKLKEYREISAKYDNVMPDQKTGFLWGQYGQAIASPLNYAFDLVGQELFIKMYSDPEIVHAYFRKIMELFEMIWEIKQEVEGSEYTFSYLGDCSNTMLSPETFEEFVLPYNQAFSKRFPNTESHNCGIVTQLLDKIPLYGPFKYVEIGWGTDLSRVRECFGADTMLLPRLGVDFMQNYSPDQVYEKAMEILKYTEGPVAIHSNCIDPEKTSEETLKTLFHAVADFEKSLTP